MGLMPTQDIAHGALQANNAQGIPRHEELTNSFFIMCICDQLPIIGSLTTWLNGGFHIRTSRYTGRFYPWVYQSRSMPDRVANLSRGLFEILGIFR